MLEYSRSIGKLNLFDNSITNEWEYQVNIIYDSYIYIIVV